MSNVLWSGPSARRDYPGFIAITRVQPNGKLTAAQRAAEHEVRKHYPHAKREDWSKGMWRLRERYCDTKRIASDGTCAVIWWAR
jgi:hypothetical protein